MTSSKKPKRTHSDESRERMRAAALARSDSKAEQIHEHVRDLLKEIQKEMAANQGIYPQNGGALSMAEVARRAEIHPNTFHKSRYVELAKEVKEWLKTVRQGATVGRMRVRKELGTRVQEWKQLYEDLLETHRITETDLDVAEAKLEEVLKENEKLRQRLADLSEHKVVKLQPKEK